MICKMCGTQNADGAKFCKGCGAKLESVESNEKRENNQTYGSNSAYAGNNSEAYGGESTNVVNNNYSRMQTSDADYIPEDYKPISMWGYFGYEVLFSIPLVGFILLLVFSFGGTKNKNLKNFARSYFCFMILTVIILAIFLGGSLGTILRYM